MIKTAAASPALLRHRGPAIVFHSYTEMRDRIDDPALDVTPDSVLVLAGCGPVGAAMPEWGMIPIPRKLLDQGVTDMLRISDARMSGTSFGTVVLHVAPESAVGGPLARLRDGDVISLDAAAGELTAEVGPAELAALLIRCCRPSPTCAAGRCCTASTSPRHRRDATTTSCRRARPARSGSPSRSSAAPDQRAGRKSLLTRSNRPERAVAAGSAPDTSKAVAPSSAASAACPGRSPCTTTSAGENSPARCAAISATVPSPTTATRAPGSGGSRVIPRQATAAARQAPPQACSPSR